MPKLPGISHRAAVGAFERAGFHIHHEGKHTVMKRGAVTLTIPRHTTINAYTMGGIVRDSGLTIDEFKALL
jgi:predicted RNA binding protein YcfA (HicA-like mRNA interferase family)